MEVKTNLKQFLTDRGIKQTWLAEKVGMKNEAMNRIVNGRYYPTLRVAIRIVRALREAGFAELNIEDLWPVDDDD
ncbi:helix-turn-helix transcriptional regulator [Alicyclobacillus tolerans]|uniref:helix-turn-helix transcriptional regulator n=1 Tax=Alicyclobacillus tolerans TaxID=90970 RepID=UPI003B7AA794